MCFHRLAGYFELAQAAGDALLNAEAVGAVQVFDDNGPHIVFDLPGTFEEWLAELTTKERSNIRRREKLLGKDHQFSYDAPDDDQSIDVLPGRLAALHQQRWKNEGLPGSFVEWPNATSFYRDCIRISRERGRLLMTSLKVDGEVIGGEYCVQFGRRLHWILSARDDGERWKLYSPGRLAFVDLVRRSIERGVTQIDGLAGDFHYKRLLGGRVLSERSIWAYRRGAAARIRVACFRFMATLLHLVYAKLWAFGLGRKLGWVRYPHPRAWIRSTFDRRLRSRGRWLKRNSAQGRETADA
jgi:CelD/BcsL family acetyltransferase involved in cellulose biosynthesis